MSDNTTASETTPAPSADTASAADRPLALVTGASRGIGLELAKVLASEGYDLYLAADEDLGLAIADLAGTTASVEAMEVDLSTGEGVERLYAGVVAHGRPLAAAMLNAGIGQGGGFLANSVEESLQVIRTNVLGTVHLAKLVLDDMVARDEGRVLVTSSVAATMPGPYQAVYNASKSFLQSFAEGLHEELADYGVSITALMPGPTDTNFFTRADMDDTKVGQGHKDDPALVARQGYDAMIDGEQKVRAGSLRSKAMNAASAVLPDAVKAKQHTRMAEPGQD